MVGLWFYGGFMTVLWLLFGGFKVVLFEHVPKIGI